MGKIRIKNNLLSSGLQDKKGPKISDKEVTYALTSNINPFFNLISCMRHFDAIRYITEIRTYYQNLMAKNKNLSRVDEEGQNAIREVGYFLNSLKNDLFKTENLINQVIEGLFESEYQRFKSKEQPLLSNVQPRDLYNFYDEFLYSKKDLTSLIKLMIIESLTQNGIIGYQKLKREILNIFG